MRTSKTLSKRVTELISTATPRKKALLVCKDWAEKNTFNKEPLLTEDEVAAIVNSLTPEDGKVYNKWLKVFNTLIDLTPLLGLVYKEYQTQAETVLGLLRQWEAYNQEENHLNTIFQELQDSGNKEAIEAFSKALSYLDFTDAEIKRDEDGYIEVDISKLYEKIKDEVEIMTSTYETAKAMVFVTEEYIKRTKSKAFLPELVKGAISDIKEDYALRVAPKYSQKQLKEKRAKGLRITKDEIKRAVYPSYEELDTPQQFIDMFREKLSGIEKYA